MINKFPLWKNLMLIGIIILGLIYASANLFGDDPAVQISGNSSSALMNTPLVDNIKQALEKSNIAYKSIDLKNNTLLIRFKNTDEQFQAQALLKGVVGNNYTVAINLAPATPNWLQAMGAMPMKLGLDLRGGIHFLLDVDVEGVISKRLDGVVKTMMDNLREKKIRYTGINRTKDNQIVINFREENYLTNALDLLKINFPNFIFTTQQANGQMQIIANPTPVYIQNIQQYTIDQMATTLRNRVNELGIAEPVVQQQGVDRISVDLPGVQDSARAKQILGGTATLEFRLVSTSGDVKSAMSGVVPAGTKLYYMTDGTPILLDNQVVLSGNSITSATSSFGQDGRPNVEISLGGGGEAYFTKVTRDNIGNRLAIVYVETKTVEQMVNGKPIKIRQKQEHVISAPVIQNALSNQFQITGLTDALEAKNLALLLRAGALPANVDIIQERTVGPTLGQENIRMGLLSVEVASLIVVIFMAIYYALFGIIADLALLVNLVLIVAIMSLLGMTLTLPGIAGVVLTVAMAVDANVLIFERIREELRNKVSPQAAIHAGFERAFNTIVDANVTTLIVAVVLFSIGTGAIQGFAVTLTVGILTSMFTAITFTRALVNWIYGGRSVKHLSIGMRKDERVMSAETAVRK